MENLAVAVPSSKSPVSVRKTAPHQEGLFYFLPTKTATLYFLRGKSVGRSLISS
jgi:hypothetical protein